MLSRKRKNSLSSGAYAMKSSSSLSSKRRKRSECGLKNSLHSTSARLRTRTMITYISLRKTRIRLYVHKRYSTSKRKTSTLMRSNALRSGKLKERMLSHWSWNSKTTKSRRSEWKATRQGRTAEWRPDLMHIMSCMNRHKGKSQVSSK